MSRFIRSPVDGRVVVAQAPNVPLWGYIAATVARLLFHPAGTAGAALSIAGGVSLAVWALLELFRGESPFRRTLGGIVLGMLLVGLVTRLIR